MITPGDLPISQEEPPVVDLRTPMRLRLSPQDRCMFIESMTNDLTVISNSWRRRDANELLARIHSLKGALLVMSEKAGVRACAAVERHIHTKGLKGCRRHIDTLRLSLRRVLDLYARAGGA